jgi:hypothetical protein
VASAQPIEITKPIPYAGDGLFPQTGALANSPTSHPTSSKLLVQAILGCCWQKRDSRKTLVVKRFPAAYCYRSLRGRTMDTPIIIPKMKKIRAIMTKVENSMVIFHSPCLLLELDAPAITLLNSTR